MINHVVAYMGKVRTKMSDVMELIQNEDGTFSAYDDTYDIVIHCETEDEQKKVIEHLRGIKLQED